MPVTSSEDTTLQNTKQQVNAVGSTNPAMNSEANPSSIKTDIV